MPEIRRTLALLAVTLIAGMGACSSLDEPVDGGSSVSDSTDLSLDDPVESAADSSSADGGNVDLVEGDAGGTPSSDPLDDDTAGASCETGTWVIELRGSVNTDAGDPAESAAVQPCIREAPSGHLTCLSPEFTGANGEYRIDIPDDLHCMQVITLRVLLIGSDHATAYCIGDLGVTDDGILAASEPIVLYSTLPAATLPELGDPDAERIVVFDDGLEVDVVPARFFGPRIDSYSDLAARRVTATDTCFLNGQVPFDGLYAFSPEGDVGDENYGLRIPNTTGLPPGTAVGLYVLGGLTTFLPSDVQVTEGEWFRYGSATVDSDGAVIEGDGLPYFAWMAYRAE